MSAAAKLPSVDVAGILKRLGIDSINAGAWSGSLGWSKDVAGALITSTNPATGDTLAQVRGATITDYEAVMRSSVEAATAWRAVPAPRRGEAIRLLGDALRAAKQDLGALVTLENGKIKAEGLGEVQEMIDICDFAVGQSRMLYGSTMHSERPQHRMYEQWHPLGVVGIISAFNFPVAVWAWNACLAAICGNVVGVEALAQDAAHRARRPAHLQQGDARERAAADLPAVHRRGQRSRHAFRGRPARGAGFVHRFDRGWTQRRRTRRAAPRQGAARARRQQRDHRRRDRPT